MTATLVLSSNTECGSSQYPLRQFAVRLIRRKAWELTHRRGFSPSDREDIEQDLRLLLLKRLPQFNPAIAHYNVFVTTVVERYVATLLEQQAAVGRSYWRAARSLNQLVDGGDGHAAEFGATLPQWQHTLRTGGRFRSAEELSDLAHDVAAQINQLPPELADICRRLQRDSISAVARQLGRPRSTLQGLVKHIALHFERQGIRNYLSVPPSSRPRVR